MDGARSSFGGTFCNPYDTEREPGMSSAGSASSVAANLVTCAIGEETVVSIRWPAAVNSLVGLAPTQELVSRDGMMGAGLNMRTGPICRSVADAAKILDVIAGYDPKDDMTVLSVGRTPSRPYASYAKAAATRRPAHRRGARVSEQEAVQPRPTSRASISSSAPLPIFASSVRPSSIPVPAGSLFQACIARSAPRLLNASFTRQYRRRFPLTLPASHQRDHIALLLELAADPSRVPEGLSLRSLGGFGAPGEDRYMMNKYLRERGDANIKTNADLAAKATFYADPNFPDRKQARLNAERGQSWTPRPACRRATRCKSCCCSACRSSGWMRSSRRRPPCRHASSPRRASRPSTGDRRLAGRCSGSRASR